MKKFAQGFIKSLLTVFLLAVFFVFMSGAAFSLGDPAAHQVFLFEHINYGGASLGFDIDQDVADLTKWRLPNSKKSWNDVISSLKLGKNVKITLYQHTNYGGTSITLQAEGQNVKNYSSLHSIGWGDYVSSFRVRMSDYAQ